MEFLIANGKVAGKNEINLNHILTVPLFRLSQKVWYGHGGIPLFTENLEQLKIQTEALQLPFPKEFENLRELFRITKRMLNKNKFFRSGYIHFQLFWEENQTHTLITANTFRDFGFPFSGNGMLVNFSVQRKQSQNPFNRFPFFNEMLWQASRAEIIKSPFDQVIILNESNSICEGAHANIFLLMENKLLTPALSTGCYEDVIRYRVIESAEQAGLKITEMQNIDRTKIFEMDEVFFASENSGIQWILGVENKRYLHSWSKKIHDLLNRKLNPNS